MTRTDLALVACLAAIFAGGLYLLDAARPARVVVASVTHPAPTTSAPADPVGLASRPPPVPLHLKHRPTVGGATVEALIATAANEPATDASAGSSTAALPETVDPGAAAARAAAEADGYRNVKVLKRGPDGTWRVSALRGRTTVMLTVDAGGAVSAD